MQPKPNPKTQARVDATDQGALAKAKADTAELTLGHWHSMLTSAGVTRTHIVVSEGKIEITLRGQRDRRFIESVTECPQGQPFPLYCMLALRAFEQGQHTATSPERLPMSVEDNGDGTINVGPTPGTELDDRVPQPDPESRALQKLADAVAKGAAPYVHEPAGDARTQGQRAAEQAADIAKRARPINIDKPAPAGAGERRPLALPLCVQCKAQPVYQSTADFCGAECARKFYTEKAARAVKGSR